MEREIRVKFFNYSANKEHFLQPNIEYDTKVMIKLGFDLILCSDSMKELGIVLHFWTKNTTRSTHERHQQT